MNAFYSWIKTFTYFAMVFVLLPSATAQSTKDSLAVVEDAFRPQQLIVPSALIAVGAFGVNNRWFYFVKEEVKEGFHDLRGDCRLSVDDYLQYLPVAAHLGLELVGGERHGILLLSGVQPLQPLML